MSTLRIVTGAAGMLGTALRHQFKESTEPAGSGGAGGLVVGYDTEPADGVVVLDVASPAFAEHLGILLSHDGDAGHFGDGSGVVDPVTRVELFHCAGTVPPLAGIAGTTVGEFRQTVDEHLVTAYAVLATLTRLAAEYGVQVGAVLMSSVGARHSHRWHVAYDAAKAGLESLARSFVLEHGQFVSVRCVAVGPIAESPTTAADGERAAALVALVPRDRYPLLVDVAQAVAAFGGPAFDDAAGHVLTLDGGLTVQLRPRAIERPPASHLTGESAGEQAVSAP